MKKKHYNQDLETLLKEYRVNSKTGISTRDADKRLAVYGPNTFTKMKQKNFLQEIKEMLSEQLMVILLIAAAISLLIGEYHDAVGICFAILLSTTIGLLTESRSKKAAEALNKMTDDIWVKVLRDGRKKQLHKSEIVPGDIVFLEAGDQVPADGRIIVALDLKVREDMLTGESADVNKNTGIIKEEEVMVSGRYVKQDPIPAKQTNMLFGGTLIASGQAEMMVTSTGDNTEMGRIAKALGEEEEVTPLQLKLDQLAQTISKVSTLIASILFVYMFAKIVAGTHLTLDFTSASRFFRSLAPLIQAFPSIKTAFIVCVALIVAAVPEGLPTMINITLAITMKQMAKINVLVRKKEACETIGSVSVICSDKTGTLTQNKMKVQKVYAEGEFKDLKELKDYPYLMNNCMLNSTAELEYVKGGIKYIGSATECALLLLYEHIDYSKERESYPVIQQLPFNSSNKYMATYVKVKENPILYVKGAPEVILKACMYQRDHGKVKPLTASDKYHLIAKIETLQLNEMRVLAFAYKEASVKEIQTEIKDLVFEGFVGIADPLREGVKESIQIAREAGIETKMLTGDNLKTAIAIGKEIGLVGPHKKAVEATYIDALTDEELRREIADISIVARSKPDTKMRIVSALQKGGEVVAVTGDGINDAPALNKADVGIAMGIAGTEVSKNAADIILTDDSFSTIVEAVKWGRGIYNNFQRFIQFQLTVNIIAFLIAIISQIMGKEMPFTTIHLLWINIIMDGPPALALGLEPIRASVMRRKPIRRDAPIINYLMVRTIVMNSIFISLILYLQIKFNFLGASSYRVHTSSEVQTVLFSLFAFSVLFNALNCREFGTGSIFPNLLKNKLALEIIVFTAILQIGMTQLAGGFFNATPLEFSLWIKIISCASLVVILNEGVKSLLRLAKYSAKSAIQVVGQIKSKEE